MLAIKPLAGSATDCAHYYASRLAGYYTHGNLCKPVYFGGCAKTLDLEGKEVAKEEIANLLLGKVKDRQLGKVSRDNIPALSRLSKKDIEELQTFAKETPDAFPEKWSGLAQKIKEIADPQNKKVTTKNTKFSKEEIQFLERCLLGANKPNLANKIEKSETKHRLGWDGTLAAPKSVSLLSLVDKRIAPAFQEAVIETLEHLQESYAQARQTKDGKVHHVRTKKLLSALFQENENRQNEPHLHTHCLLFNFTEAADQLRSMGSSLGLFRRGHIQIEGFYEEILANQAVLGQYFRAGLAYRMRKLGYNIAIDKKGLIEIEGVSEEFIRAFSGGSKAIKDDLARRGKDGAKEAAVSQQNTKKGKDEMGTDAMLRNIEKFSQNNLDGREILENLQHHALENDRTPASETEAAKDAIEKAIASLSERQTSFSMHAVLASASNFRAGEWSFETAKATLQKMAKEGTIIPLSVRKKNSDVIFSTETNLAKEKDRLAFANNLETDDKDLALHLQTMRPNCRLHRILSPLANRKKAISLLDIHDQKTRVNAMAEVAISQRHKGKAIWLTPSLHHVSSDSLLSDRVWHADGLAKTTRLFLQNIIAKRLAKEWNYRTVSDYLANPTSAGTILIDHAHALTEKQFDRLSEIAKTQGIRLVLAGDSHRVCRSIDVFSKLAEQPDLAIKYTLPSLRARTVQGSAIHYLRHRRIDRALETIAPCVHGSFDFEEKAVAHFAKNPDRIHTEFLATSKDDCARLTARIRQSLRQEKKLGEDHLAETWQPVTLSSHERMLAKNYSKRTILRIFSTNPDFKGGFYGVNSVKEGGLLNLSRIGIEDSNIDLSLHQMKRLGMRATVFEKKPTLIAVGDRIRYRASFTNAGLHAGDHFEILSIDENNLHVRSIETGLERTIDRNTIEGKTFDQAWVRTQAQKGFADPTASIALQPTATKATNRASLYTFLSDNAQGNVRIYTDNAEKWQNAIHTRTGQFSSEANKTASELKRLEAVLEDTLKQLAPTTEKPASKIVEEAISALFEKQVATNPTEIFKKALTKAVGHALPKETLAYLEKIIEKDKRIEGLFVATKMADAIDYKSLKIKLLKQEPAPEKSKDSLEKKKEPEESPPEHWELTCDGIESADLVDRVTRDYRASNIRADIFWCAKTNRAILSLPQQKNGKTRPASVARAYLPKRALLHWTLLSQKKAEQAIIDETHGTRATPFSKAESFADGLSAEQQAVFDAVVFGEKKNLLIQGRAGTGKTTVLAAIHKALRDRDIAMIALAPTHTAVAELTDRGIPSQTTASFLNGADAAKDSIVVIDESSMLDTETAKKIIDKTKNVKRVLVGDDKQLSAIPWGTPFGQLQNQPHTETINLSEIHRQKTAHLKKAVAQIYQGKGADALQTLQENGGLIDRAHLEEERATKDGKEPNGEKKPVSIAFSIAEDYMSRSKDNRDHTLLIAAHNVGRKSVNARIRALKIEKGEIDEDGIDTRILELKQVGSGKADKLAVSHFEIGQQLRFSSGGFGKTNAYYEIIEKDFAKEQLTVLQNGEKQTIELSKLSTENTPEVYEEDSRTIAKNEHIVFTRSERSTDTRSSNYAKIEKILENGYILVSLCHGPEDGWNPTGEKRLIDLKDPINQHFDHADCITIHRSQGKTVDEVMAWIPSDSVLSNQQNALVSITRARACATVYTDCTDLIKNAMAHTGKKPTALSMQKQAETVSAQIRGQGSNNVWQEMPTEKTKPTIAHAKKQPPKEWYDLSAIKTRLNADAAKIIASHPIGVLKRTQGAERHFSASGKGQGSLAVNIEKGTWYDHKTGEGGDMLGWIKRASGISDFKELCRYASSLVGLSPTEKRQVSNLLQKAKVKHEEKKVFDADEKKRIAYAKRIADGTRPIKGTLAETYLREHRGIAIEKLPDSLRFHPNLYSGLNKKVAPALVALATDKDGNLQAVQATYLDAKGQKKEDCHVKKQTFGVLHGASVSLSDESPEETIAQEQKTGIAEGVETALSVLQACPNMDIHAVLGKSNMKNIAPEKLKEHIIVLSDHDEGDDDDGRTGTGTGSLDAKFKSYGKKISFARPPKVGDFNDVHREHGIDAVRHIIDDEAHALEQERMEEKHEERRLQNRQRQQMMRQALKF